MEVVEGAAVGWVNEPPMPQRPQSRLEVPSDPQMFDTIGTHGSDPGALVDLLDGPVVSERGELAMAALGVLLPCQRDAVDMVVFARLSYREAGVLLHVAPSTVYRRLRAACTKMREEVERHEAG
jgi:DNA-directed RNA polymerase specialized sigma24 family protein